MAYSLFDPDPPEPAGGLLQKLKKLVPQNETSKAPAEQPVLKTFENTARPDHMDARQRQIYLADALKARWP